MVVGGWIGVGVGVAVWGCGGAPYMHAYADTCIHICICMLNMINMDASMGVAICNFYTCIHVCVCMFMCECACAHVWEYPHAARCPQTPLPTHLPLPRAAGNPNTKFNKSWTNQDISILFEDSLPLNIPEFI